jgi:inosine/xanthosine triphosphatase
LKTIIVASHNPVKISAVESGFRRMFPGDAFEIQPISVSSGVKDQPITDSETLSGACNRAQNAAHKRPDADYWVGVEGGIEDQHGDMAAFAWVVVQSQDQVGKGRTGAFYLPVAVAELVRQGAELGEADDIVFGRQNSKQEEGAVGLLTGNVLDRSGFYEQAVVLALIPFKNPPLYSK